MPEPLAEYHALLEKVDAFTARAVSAQQQWLVCRRGCDRCCLTGRTAWAVEGAHISAWLAAMDRSRVAELRSRRDDPRVVAGERCVFLDSDGSCAVYRARPILCRTHGSAVTSSDSGLVHCELNFSGLSGERLTEVLDPTCVLDLDHLDALLAVVNARYLERCAGPARIPLTEALDPDVTGLE